jgi:hypothetical protein
VGKLHGQKAAKVLIAPLGREPSRCWTVMLGDAFIKADTPTVQTDRAGSEVSDWR